MQISSSSETGETETPEESAAGEGEAGVEWPQALKAKTRKNRQKRERNFVMATTCS